MSENIRCDCCGREIARMEGYLLGTGVVVSAPGFWRRFFERHPEEFRQIGFTHFEAWVGTAVQVQMAAQIAATPTDWLVCQDCIEVFSVDRESARIHAHLWWSSEGQYASPKGGPATQEELEHGLRAALTPPGAEMAHQSQAEAAPPAAVFEALQAEPFVPSAFTDSVPPEAVEGEAPGGVAALGPVVVEAKTDAQPVRVEEPVRVRPLKPPRGVRRHFLNVLLLNLNGLGLGHFYMRRLLSGILYLLGLVGLLAGAFFSQNILLSGLELSLAVVWMLASVLHGAWVLRRFAKTSPGEAAPPLSRWAAGLAILILAVEAGAIWGYTALGERNFAAAESAYQDADYAEALQRYSRSTGFYKLTFSNNLSKAKARIDECYLLVFAEDQTRQQNFLQAAGAYQAYLELYPQSLLVAKAQLNLYAVYFAWVEGLLQQNQYEEALNLTRELAVISIEAEQKTQTEELSARVYQEWGDRLLEQAEYTEAIALYRAMQESYPSTSYGRAAQEKIGQALLQYATTMAEQKQYAPAEAAFADLIAQYRSTELGEQARAEAAAMYYRWAEEAEKEHAYTQALRLYELVYHAFADTPPAVECKEKIARMHEQLAVQFQNQGQYAEAIVHYLIVANDFPDTQVGMKAEEHLSNLHQDWANSLSAEHSYEKALDVYWLLIGYYPAQKAGMEAPNRAAGVYADWASTFIQAGEYTAAIEKYNQLIETFPQTPMAQQAADVIPQVYMDWAAALSQEGNYDQALQTLNIVFSLSPAPEVITAAQNQITDTYLNWGRELFSDRKYQLSMEKYLQAQQSTTDASLIEIAKKAFDLAVQELSRDSGADGQAVLTESQNLACSGEAAVSPAVGLLENEKGRALMCDSNFSLPYNLRATIPGHFKYVISAERGISEWRCPLYRYVDCYGYSCPTFTVYRKRQWIDLKVRSVLTGKIVSSTRINGSNPPSCPSYWDGSVASLENYLFGGLPADSDVSNWLSSVFR